MTAHFLTPSKLALLALIEVYTDAIVPVPATIPILSFVLNQLLPKDTPFVLTVSSFESLLSGIPATGFPGGALWDDFLKRLTLWDHFLKKLWDIDSLDALHVFIERRSNLLARTRDEARRDSEFGIPPPSPDMIILSRTSPLGSFVRRAKVEFARLPFSHAQSLWTAFVRWRQETRTHWARKNGMLNRWAGDKALCDGEEEWGPEATEMLELVAYGGLSIDEGGEGGEGGAGFVSTGDVEKLLEFQVEQMQSKGSRIPLEVRDRFKGILDNSVTIPSLSYYVDFLDAWRAGDYPTSFDNLHRYFDYTMQNRDRLSYQYALMNLAVLQADFGCFDEAVSAMLETVSTARENKDLPCLNFALNWLYHFGKAHPKVIKGAQSTNMLGGGRELLLYLRKKARDAEMWTLWSSALLAEAKLGMSNGESVAAAFQNILKSSQLIVDKNLKSMMGPQMAMTAALWGRIGVTHLSSQYCQIFLASHSRSALFDDTLRFTCRVAHFLAEKGLYDEAMEKIESLDENSLRSWKANQYWLKYRGILRLKRDLHRNNLDGAEQLLAQLLHRNGPDADPDLGFEINLLHIDFLIRRTDFSGALSRIEELASAVQEDGDDINMRVKLLTMKALLQDKAGRPQKGFSVAVRAASIAWRARLLPGLWAAMGAIANILTSLSEFHASSQILISILPRALELENCSLNAQLYSFLVDAYMGIAGQAEQKSRKRREGLTRCLEFVDRAFSEYSAVEDINGQCEMLAKKGMIMRTLGDLKQANDCASAYLDLAMEKEALDK